MKKAVYIILIMSLAAGMAMVSPSLAGWENLYFKPQHWVTGVVQNSNDAKLNPDGVAAGKSVQLYREGDSNNFAQGVVNAGGQYAINSYRLTGNTWAIGSDLRAIVQMPASNYEAGPALLQNPPSRGYGVEAMADMQLRSKDEHLPGSQLYLTAFFDGYHSSNARNEIDVLVEAHQTISINDADGVVTFPNPPLASTTIRLNNNGSGYNGFGVDLDGEYYLVFKHYNHLTIMTGQQVRLYPDPATHPGSQNTEFSLAGDDANSKIYKPKIAGMLEPLRPVLEIDRPSDLANLVWIIPGGNIDSDFKVDIFDSSLWSNANGAVPDPQDPRSATWNLNADCNGDNQVSIYDSSVWSNNNGLISYIR